METVAVILPAYNAVKWIETAVNSCLRQTIKPAEIHVVDDGSADGTLDLVSRFDGVHRHAIAHGGVAKARNHGAEQSSSDWLLFLDADDRLLPTAIEDLLEAAHAENAILSYGMVIERREPPLTARLNGFDYCKGEPPAPASANINRCAIITPGSAIVRRSVFNEAGGFTPGTEPMEDRDLWLRCGLIGRFAHSDKVVLDKAWHPQSHGSQHAKRIYRGWLAKRRLRQWGEARNYNVNWIPPDRMLVTDAIKEALHWKCWEVLDPLLRDSESLRVSNQWTLRARVVIAALRLLGRSPAIPTWIQDSAGLV